MKKTIYTIFCLVCASASIGCSEPNQGPQPEVIRPAKMMEVVATDNIKQYRFPAVVEALSSKELTFQVSGQVVSLEVREGDPISRGEIIAKVDQRVYQNQLTSAETQYETAKIEYERSQRLMAADAIAKSIFDSRKTAFNVAEAQLDNAKKSLEDTTLLAPFDGVIADTHVEELDAVTTASPIVTIQTDGPAEARVKVPASLVSRVKQMKPVDTFVQLDSQINSDPIPAKIAGIVALADERSQTFELRFSFEPGPNMTVLPGMTGVVISNIAFEDEADQIGKIMVPMGAVNSDAQGAYVWTVNTDTNKVLRRDVSVSDIDGDNITIVRGLRNGETIITAGGAYLQDGMTVRPLES